MRPLPALLLALHCAAAPPLAAAEFDAPSGQSLELYDVVLDTERDVARFLFRAPGIAVEPGAGRSYAEVQEDFPWICEGIVLPALRDNAWEAAEVVISMADREVPFGDSDPEAVQFFEVFRIEDATCIWEGF